MNDRHAFILRFIPLFLVTLIPAFRLPAADVRETQQAVYYWKSIPVGDTAQLLTLFCRDCRSSDSESHDLPLVSVLRDTLGDTDPRNDRVMYVWLLSYQRPTIGQRILSAVPFFYWRVGERSGKMNLRDTAPLIDLQQPEHPMFNEFRRDLLQWTALDPRTTPIRATSRAYRSNEVDQERLHLEEAVTYLRQAPVADDGSALTRAQLSTVIARLELRKRLLGGFVSELQAKRFGEEWSFEQERVRARNWELLRESAERTGLYFESLDVVGAQRQYAILWFPYTESSEPAGTSLSSVWKLLNIKDPWHDERVKNWDGPVYERALDENGSILPFGAIGAQRAKLIPLGVYSLDYPKVPLLLVDFRDKLHARWHEMAQRCINEITAGVIGISHFTSWYYYVGAEIYNFVVARHGGAVNQASRLDCYSQFRVALALDRTLNPVLRRQIQRGVDSLSVNPLEVAPDHELAVASARYIELAKQAGVDGALVARLNKDRREELELAGESSQQILRDTAFHELSFGAYTHRVKGQDDVLAQLALYRRAEYELTFLDSVVKAGTDPEVSYSPALVQNSVAEVGAVMPKIESQRLRAQAGTTLERVKELSRDEALRADCAMAVASIRNNGSPVKSGSAPGVVAAPGIVTGRIGSLIAPGDTLQ
ncbi:MAG: hypothetical protein WB676_04160 [Bryobacteraceae bacterium]